MKPFFERIFRPHRGYRTLLPTLCFLLVAGLLVYGCIRLVSDAIRSGKQQLRLSDPTPTARAVPTPSPTPESAEPVSLILAPQTASPTASPAPATSAPTASAAPDFTVTPAQSPAVTPLPVQHAAPFTNERMELLLMGLDAANAIDFAFILSIRGGDCRAYAVPRNILTASGDPLSAYLGGTDCRQALTTVFPMRFSQYAIVHTESIPKCVDVFGTVQLNGKALDGEAAAQYLASGGADELIRIERQQTFLKSYLSLLKSVGWLRLIAAKYTLQPVVESSIPLHQLAMLYAVLRRTEPADIVFTTIPDDSVQLDGKRFYQPDTALINQIVQTRFGP